MVIVNPKPADPADLNNKRLNEFQWDAEAHRQFLVDSTGTNISGTNPLPVVGTSKTHDDLEGSGYLAVGTTAVELTFTGTTEAIIITAKNTNTGLIFVGKSTVTNLGVNSITFLAAGESLTIDYEDSTNALFVVSDTAAQSVMVGAVK